MTITTLKALPTREAFKFLPLLESFIAWRQDAMPESVGAALTVPQDEWPSELGVDSDAIVFLLPDDLEVDLAGLASQPLDVYNRHSDDLLTNTTFLALHSEAVAVEFDAWLMAPFNACVRTGRFYLFLVSNRTALVVRHDLGLDGVDTFLGGVHGACGSSGPNYRPYRVWSDEELEAAAQGSRPAADPSWHEPARRVVCQVVKINNAERPE